MKIRQTGIRLLLYLQLVIIFLICFLTSQFYIEVNFNFICLKILFILGLSQAINSLRTCSYIWCTRTKTRSKIYFS